MQNVFQRCSELPTAAPVLDVSVHGMLALLMSLAGRPNVSALAFCAPLLCALTCGPLATALGSEASETSRKDATGAAARVVELLGRIESTLVDSHYSPITRVDPKLGRYEFDCSGMASWVLQRAAPGAWQSVRAYSATGRVVARDFVRAIAAVGIERPSWAWQRVARVKDAQPGDVIAWLKPAGWQSPITGHVGFVLERPIASKRVPGGYLLRFADASRYQHQDDTRAATGRDGFGSGTLLFMADPQTGAPKAYGWFGDLSTWISETQIMIGRPRH